MKKTLLALLIILEAMLLFACHGDTPSDGSKPNGNDPEKPDGTSYSAVVTDGSAQLGDIVNALIASAGENIPLKMSTSEAEGVEIIFGNTDRDASTEGYEVLDALLEDRGENHFGYVIYKAKDGNVAICWNNEYAIEFMTARFLESFTDVEALKGRAPGVLASEFFDLDEYINGKAWEKIEATAPAEVAAALKKLNSFYDGSTIMEWMANLYDPYICVCKQCDPAKDEIACYGGAFYFSNSARDYSGFLPDAESTVQLLRWMDNNGAFERYSDYGDALPESVKAKIIKFAQSLQDEGDGYFYHPQWGKNIATDRKGRDLGWGISLLSVLGAEPLYPTATDRLQGKSTAHLTSPISKNKVSAVSAVISTASAFEEALKSEEAYMEWLIATTKGDDMFKDSAGAHTINASASQIKAAGYQEITLNYLDAQQEKLFNEMNAAYLADPENNPRPTGLWQRTADYSAVWGLLKFAALYNREIKYAEYGIRTCIEAIKIDAEEGMPYYMNDVYNQWQGATNLISNAAKYRPEIVPTLYELMNEDAVAMIENSINKVRKFKCEDGGFSYRMDMAPPKMYGSLTALGVKESDVNATSLACSMYRAIFTSLGYDYVNLCDYRDGERFIEIITATEPIEKIERASSKPYTFDEKPTSMAENFNGGYTEIVADARDPQNNVIKYVSESSEVAGDSLVFEVYEETVGANCFVFEIDMMVESGNQQMLYQFRIANSGSKNAYMFVVLYEDGKIKIADNPTTSNTTNMVRLGAEAELGEWFHLRFEYYTDPTMPTIKFYFNGELTAVSHNYFGSNNGSAPVNTYTEARLMALKKTDAVCYIDNAFFAKINKEYVEETVE